MVKIILILILLTVFLPGLLVHIQSLLFLRRKGEYNTIWQTFSPGTLLITIILVFPIYSFGIYSFLFSPIEVKKQGVKSVQERIRSEGGDMVLKESVVHGMAKVLGVKLEE